MTRTHWSALGPGFVVAAGFLGSTALAVANAGSMWGAAAAALPLACSLLTADLLARRQRGELPRPSGQTLLLAGAFLVACGMLAATEPASVAMMIPVLGAGVAVPVLQGTGRARGACRAVAPGSTS